MPAGTVAARVVPDRSRPWYTIDVDGWFHAREGEPRKWGVGMKSFGTGARFEIQALQILLRRSSSRGDGSGGLLPGLDALGRIRES